MPKLVEGNQETGTLKNIIKDKFGFNNNVIEIGRASCRERV